MLLTRKMFRPIVAILLAASAVAAHAEDAYPNRPVRLIVPLGAGSATDVLARVIAESLTHELKNTFVVENKAGAGGAIGADFVAKAKPDGYTLGFFHSSVLSASAAINPKLPYDPRKDFTPLGIAASNPIVLAVPVNSRFKTLEELIDAAKKEPGKYTSGFIGVGSHSQFNLELLNIVSGAKITAIPYAGGTGPLLTGLLGNQIDSASALWAAFSAQVAAGKLRLLATAAPLKELPDVPTFASKGYERANMEVFSVLMGPPHLPKEIADQLARALERSVKDPKVAQKIENLGFLVRYGSPQELSTKVAEETKLLTEVAEKVGIKVE